MIMWITELVSFTIKTQYFYTFPILGTSTQRALLVITQPFRNNVCHNTVVCSKPSQYICLQKGAFTKSTASNSYIISKPPFARNTVVRVGTRLGTRKMKERGLISVSGKLFSSSKLLDRFWAKLVYSVNMNGALIPKKKTLAWRWPPTST